MEFPSLEEEQLQQSTVLINNQQGNSFASDESGNQFSVEAIEAENPLIEDSENTCPLDQSEYCQGRSESENSFKTSNHTMCKYCVSLGFL